MVRAGMNLYDHDNTQEEIANDIAAKMIAVDQAAALAKDRLRMGTYRYGVANHDNYDYRMRLDTKLERYDDTGNLEFLIDAMNYCILEFNWPSRDGTFFAVAENDEGSKRGYDK